MIPKHSFHSKMDYSSGQGEKSQRTCLEKLLYDLDILANKFSKKISKFSLLQYDNFNEIKNEIDIKRETRNAPNARQ